MTRQLPRTAKDVFKLTPRDWLLYNGVIAIARATGIWRYPIAASGDIETMTVKDLIYWLYKAQFPIKNAVRGSGLEDYFVGASRVDWTLPSGFTPISALRLSAVGDLMDHPYLPNSAECLYEDVADAIFGADISMANLECVVYPEATGSFVIRPTEAPPLFYKREHFDAVKGISGRRYAFMATACNHSLDCGEAGVRSTIGTLRSEGIACHGMNDSEANAGTATIIETKGFRIGVVSHTFGLNARKPPRDKPWMVNRTHLNGAVRDVDFSLLGRQLRSCDEQAADITVAQLHWGLEHEYYPRPEQLEVAHHIAEMGADIIIGHHPHVVQPMEAYRTKRDPNRLVPIYYSLGNLITPFSHPAFRRSQLARITLAKCVGPEGATSTYVTGAEGVGLLLEIVESDRTIRLVL